MLCTFCVNLFPAGVLTISPAGDAYRIRVQVFVLSIHVSEEGRYTLVVSPVHTSFSVTPAPYVSLCENDIHTRKEDFLFLYIYNDFSVQILSRI